MENKKKGIIACNIIFPAWLWYFGSMLVPLFLLILLPANFLADSLVLYLLFSLLKLPEKRRLYKKLIWKTWGCGFLADFIASGVLFLINCSIRLPFLIYGSVMPWENPGGFLFVTAGIALAGILIYFFQKKIVLKGIGLEEKQAHRLALGMAVLTAPYLMYLPPM